MEHYNKSQVGWIMPLIFVLSFILFWLAYKNQWGNIPVDKNGLVVFTGIFVIVLLLFFRLKVTVDNDFITTSFGIGIIKFVIPIMEIREVVSVKNKWYNGYGIRMLSNGWLYNIGGKKAVELHFKTKTGTTRIGTPEPEVLKAIIDQHLKIKSHV